MREPKTYHVFVGGKTRRSKPRLVQKMKGKKNAEKVAKDWQKQHPDRLVGIFELKRVRVFKPKKR